MKLGKKAAKIDPRALKLARYVTPTIPTPPVNCGYIDQVPNWGMMLNDSLGDCTCAAAGHMIAQWTKYAQTTEFTPSDGQILTAYKAVSGYNGDPSTDNGAVMVDVLNYWRQKGIAGHQIYAYVSVDPKNRKEIEQTVMLFGNCYVGVALPISAQNPPTGVNGKPVWLNPPQGLSGDGEPGSWGGHCIPIVGYGVDSQGNEGTMVVSWGQLFDMTWGFIRNYCDEAYAVLSMDWIAKSGLSASSFNFGQLQADLNQL